MRMPYHSSVCIRILLCGSFYLVVLHDLGCVLEDLGGFSAAWAMGWSAGLGWGLEGVARVILVHFLAFWFCFS